MASQTGHGIIKCRESVQRAEQRVLASLRHYFEGAGPAPETAMGCVAQL